MLKTVSKQKKQVLSFSCSPELSNRINNICEYQGCTKSWLMNKALEQYLLELEEDAEDYKIAEKRWKEYLASGEKTIPAEEVYKGLGL